MLIVAIVPLRASLTARAEGTCMCMCPWLLVLGLLLPMRKTDHHPVRVMMISETSRNLEIIIRSECCSKHAMGHGAWGIHHSRRTP